MVGMIQDTLPQAERLLTVGDVARHLSISRSKIYSTMDCGELPYVKLGKSRRIRWSDVLELIERCRIDGSRC